MAFNLQTFLASFPGLNRANEKAATMPHFTLCASDNLAPHAISQWINDATAAGVEPEKLDEAIRLQAAITQWRAENPEQCKLPD